MELQLAERDSKSPERRDFYGVPTILIVDDDKGVRDYVATVLLCPDYKVLTAENGTAALTLAGNHKGRLRMLITDILMPGMTGLYLAARVTQLYPDTGVLMISAHEPDALTIGEGWRFLSKPFSAPELRRVVSEILEARCKSRPPQRESLGRDARSLSGWKAG